MTKRGEPQAGHSARPLDDALTAVVSRMADELVDAKNLVALAKREEQRVAKQAEFAEKTVEQWGQCATSAARAGDDVTAKEALARKYEYERTAAALRTARVDQRGEVDRLKARLTQQSLRVEETKRRKNVIVLRALGAHAEGRLVEMTGDPHRDAPEELLARLEASLAAIEREAEVARELSDGALLSGAADAGRSEAELVGLKNLAKASPARRARKPLAKTTAPGSLGRRARASGSRERRTKR